jgi:hypothetical protein
VEHPSVCPEKGPEPQKVLMLPPMKPPKSVSFRFLGISKKVEQYDLSLYQWDFIFLPFWGCL